MSVEILALSGALGGEVTGMSLPRSLDTEATEALREAFLRYHLLCVRSEPLSAEDLVAFSRVFGEAKPHVLKRRRREDVPEVATMESTYKAAENKPADLATDRRSAWHTDDSYLEHPAKITILQALEVPDSGGQTRFCNTRQAFEDLSEDEQQRLDGLDAVHGYDTERAPARAATRTQEEIDATPEVVHPLVRTHEDTGSKSFFFNPNRTDRVVGMERGESDQLLDWVYKTVTQDRYRYNHTWRTGDILVWDNRCPLHSVNMDFPVGQTRLHQRILIGGPRPR